jgi:uncharacterized protein YbjT (DUF2867 family)
MKIAVAGGTGQAGREVVESLRRSGVEPVVIARSCGVDIGSGEGLDAALAGVDALVDATNMPAADAAAARERFGSATRSLLAAEERAGVRHHVLLSIMGLDRIEGSAHYAGKRMQEELVRQGDIPFTIVRASQFFEFPAMLVRWLARDGSVALPPLLIQPVAVADVGDVLAEVAMGPGEGRTIDLCGPEPQDLVDMARRTLGARGEAIRIVPSWRAGIFGPDAAGEVLLPSSQARIAPTTFDEWLAVGAR